MRPHLPSAAAAGLLAACVAFAPGASAGLYGAERSSKPPAPVLIDQAMKSGALDSATGHRYLALALTAPDQLPAQYQSDTPFHGTVWLHKVKNAVGAMPEGPERGEIEAALGGDPEPMAPGTSICELTPAPTTDTLITAHFQIEYNAAEVNLGPDGLDINYYAQSLENVWNTEIDSFGWAAPPRMTPDPTNGKYLVRISNLGPVLYGYVSNFGTGAGLVGDNPNTAWNDQDAYSSCMGLNSDYATFPGTPARALDATTAHEFNHSIQFGIGGLHGANTPDTAFVEGGATWMEDEAMDYANDNYNYLWPDFDDDLGEHEGDPYGYFITFRGMTERYGTAVAGGGENVMQAFWELTSQNLGSNLQAMNMALQQRGTTLADAYHAYAIAVKFNRACGGLYVYPYCLEEGPQYVNGDGVQNGAGPTPVHATIAGVPGSVTRNLPDNYALNWIALPKRATAYKVLLKNNNLAGGSFRVTVACDTGSKITRTVLPGLAGPGQTIQAKVSKSNTCQQIVAVITNQAQTAANPAASTDRSYTLSTAQAGTTG